MNFVVINVDKVNFQFEGWNYPILKTKLLPLNNFQQFANTTRTDLQKTKKEGFCPPYPPNKAPFM